MLIDMINPTLNSVLNATGQALMFSAVLIKSQPDPQELALVQVMPRNYFQKISVIAKGFFALIGILVSLYSVFFLHPSIGKGILKIIIALVFGWCAYGLVETISKLIGRFVPLVWSLFQLVIKPIIFWVAVLLISSDAIEILMYRK